MSTLRWILLVLGVVIIAAIYFAGRRKEQQSGNRREPNLGHIGDQSNEPGPANEQNSTLNDCDTDESELVDFDDLIARGLETEVADFRPQITQEPAQETKFISKSSKATDDTMLLDQELVVLNLFAASNQSFSGPQLYAAMDDAHFSWKDDQLFHCEGQKGEYLALNALKPGTFPQEPAEFSTAAVALILQLSKVNTPVEAFDEFLHIAKKLQSDLGARLCDGQRSSLTGQTITYLRDEVRQYQFKHR